MHRQRSPIDLAIEGVWLVALALVPLVFSGRDIVVLFLQPKDFILHAAALSILVLWGFDWALGRYQTQFTPDSWASIRHWLGRNPRNWAVTAAAGFGVAVVLSTIFSPLPAVSLWGRDFASLGYEMYSVLSFLVIFFAIALRLRDEQQVRRIFWAISGAGVIAGGYGISQHFGWDPIGFGAGQTRVIGSFGNPIFFGSYLVMSGSITLGLALDNSRSADRWWLPLIAALLGVQLAALWFTGSRGPWIGSAVGLLSFAGLGAITFNRSSAVRAGLTVVAGIVVAGIIVNLPGDAIEGESRGVGSIVSGVTPASAQVGGRADIWEGSLRLIDSWENQPTESGVGSALRPIFGLGPEMYFYSYPLVSNPQNGVIVVSHAHNFPLQVFLELGLAGFVTFTVLAISVLAAAIGFLRTRGRTDNWLSIAMLAVIAGLLGRGAEQMVGVARVGDLVLFWALLAAALAIYGLGHATEARSGASDTQFRIQRSYYRLGSAAVLLVLALAVFGLRDVQMLRSGLIAADAFGEAAAGNRTEATQKLQRAATISPDVQQYGVWAGELLVEEARAHTDPQSALPLLNEAYNAFVQYEGRDPLAFTTQLRVGLTEVELVNRGDLSLLETMVQRSFRIANSMPAYPAVQAVAAERVLIGGQLELGLELADKAIAMEGATSTQTLAWFMRGNALGDLGDAEGALEAFMAALEREPEGLLAPSIHRNMALAYDSIGNTDLASQHRARAEEIETSR